MAPQHIFIRWRVGLISWNIGFNLMEAHDPRLFLMHDGCCFKLMLHQGVQLQYGSGNAKSPFPRKRAEKMGHREASESLFSKDVSSHSKLLALPTERKCSSQL